MAPQARSGALGKVAGLLTCFTLWTFGVLLVFDHVATEKLTALQAPLQAELHDMRQKHGPLQQQLNDLRQKNAELEQRVHEASVAPPQAQAGHAAPRRLGGVMNILAFASNTAVSGCISFTADAQTFDMSATTGSGANNVRIPPCFIALATHAGISVNIKKCSGALVGGSALSSQAIEIVFINEDDDQVLTINGYDAGGAITGNVFKLGPKSSVVAHCSSASAHTIVFPRMSEICPSGCDSNTPSDETGTAFTVALWSTKCPKGCDAAVPAGTDASDFSVVEFIPKAVVEFLADAPPTAAVTYDTNGACAGGATTACMAR